MNINNNVNGTYKLIDGAYTDNSALAITLSNLIKNNPNSSNQIFKIISLNHSPLKKNKDKIDTSSFDLYRLFNNKESSSPIKDNPIVDGPIAGTVPNSILFQEPMPTSISTSVEDWNWNDYKNIKYHIGNYTTINNSNYGIKAGYRIQLFIICFNWKTGMIDYNISIKQLKRKLDIEYKQLCYDTISELIDFKNKFIKI